MCRAAVVDGVKTLVATPRWDAGRIEPPLSFKDCQGKLAHLEAELAGALTLKLGFELQFSLQLPELIERYGSMLALGGKKHLLIALSALRVPNEVEEVWREIAKQGFSVVVAQPECNAKLRRDPARVARWVASGVTLQIDAASVAGAHGRDIRRFALDCLRQYKGRALVASNARGKEPRGNSLGKARAELLAHMGARPTEQLMRETPTSIISDEIVTSEKQGVFTRRLASLLNSFIPRSRLASER
jgi:protein-tyrosine phosphatase